MLGIKAVLLTSGKTAPVQMDRPKRLTQILLAGVTAFGLMSSHAHALDQKSLHGSACQATFGTHVADIVSDWSGIRNTAAVPRPVTCPVERDDAARDSLDAVWLTLRQPVGATTSCRVSSHSILGAIVDSQWITRSGDSFMSFPRVDQSPIYGSYTVICVLAPGAILTNVQWFENGPTDSL